MGEKRGVEIWFVKTRARRVSGTRRSNRDSKNEHLEVVASVDELCTFNRTCSSGNFDWPIRRARMEIHRRKYHWLHILTPNAPQLSWDTPDIIGLAD